MSHCDLWSLFYTPALGCFSLRKTLDFDDCIKINRSCSTALWEPDWSLEGFIRTGAVQTTKNIHLATKKTKTVSHTNTICILPDRYCLAATLLECSVNIEQRCNDRWRFLPLDTVGLEWELSLRAWCFYCWWCPDISSHHHLFSVHLRHTSQSLQSNTKRTNHCFCRQSTSLLACFRNNCCMACKLHQLGLIRKQITLCFCTI